MAKALYRSVGGEKRETGSVFVRRLSCFVPLDPVTATRVQTVLGRPVQFSSGSDIIIEGVPRPSEYVIEEGWACSYKLLRSGKRQILSLLLPGDHTSQGEMAPNEATCSVLALTPVIARTCRQSRLVRLGESDPKLERALDASHHLELAIFRDHLVCIGQRDAYQRLAYLILELHYRLRMVGLADRSSFEVRITQEMMADTLGLSNVHVNRTLRRLADHGVAVAKGDRLRIIDWDTLVDIADFHETFLGQFARSNGQSYHALAAVPAAPWSDKRTASANGLSVSTGDLP